MSILAHRCQQAVRSRGQLAAALLLAVGRSRWHGGVYTSYTVSLTAKLHGVQSGVQQYLVVLELLLPPRKGVYKARLP